MIRGTGGTVMPLSRSTSRTAPLSSVCKYKATHVHSPFSCDRLRFTAVTKSRSRQSCHGATDDAQVTAMQQATAAGHQLHLQLIFSRPAPA